VKAFEAGATSIVADVLGETPLALEAVKVKVSPTKKLGAGV
jgi:hypothetical protein